MFRERCAILQPDRIEYCFSLKHELPGIQRAWKRTRESSFWQGGASSYSHVHRRSGGIIILGVSEQPNGFSFDGLTPEQLATWKYETIADGFNSYTT